jgi:hypothetical protein
MGIDRRLALSAVAAIALGAAIDPLRAQNLSSFDPVATARLRAGEIAREIAASGRDASVPEPSRDDIFNTGLLLQAGLRALLPVQERQGIALPGTPSSSDPSELIATQENYNRARRRHPRKRRRRSSPSNWRRNSSERGATRCWLGK